MNSFCSTIMIYFLDGNLSVTMVISNATFIATWSTVYLIQRVSIKNWKETNGFDEEVSNNFDKKIYESCFPIIV